MVASATCGEWEKMGLFWDLNEDIILLHKEEIADGDTQVNDFALAYEPQVEDLGDTKYLPFLLEDGVIISQYGKWGTNTGTSPLGLYFDYPVVLDAVGGPTQFVGSDFSGDFTRGALAAYSPWYYSYVLGPRFGFTGESPVSSTDWSITDGTQTIYFSNSYKGNTADTLVGFGDDDDGSTIGKSPTSDAYDINFKQATTGPVVTSAYPCLIANIRTHPDQEVDFYYPVVSGVVDLVYPYSPYHQKVF